MSAGCWTLLLFRPRQLRGPESGPESGPELMQHECIDVVGEGGRGDGDG